jgi:hypothetical protein
MDSWRRRRTALSVIDTDADGEPVQSALFRNFWQQMPLVVYASCEPTSNLADTDANGEPVASLDLCDVLDAWKLLSSVV